ncbi:esterase-like activity of phytase family protein [Ramlibacter sp. PS3R-8]|uniref:esterase-like activity of phytase family protein n=1 Tax=Ramlibacter sp. PS3R-8 TaxID=3133437 RepID=UPI0030AF2720
MPIATPFTQRRAFLRACGAVPAAALVGCATPGKTAPQRLRLLGESTLPYRMNFQGTTVGGLSGLDHDPSTGMWVALCDDRSELQPARFYTLDVTLAGRNIAVEVRGVTTLRTAAGQPFPRRQLGGEVVDPEAIRLLPHGAGLLWTSEGDHRANQSPTLRHARLDGSQVREFEVPAHLQFATTPGAGARDNNTFEGLALTPDARTAWVAMEAALHQDGPEPGVGRPGGPCRITAFDVASGRAVRQIAYLPDAVPRAPLLPGGFSDNGVSEILMLDAQRMLVLERSFSMGVGMSLRLYEIDTSAASDTLSVQRLMAGGYRPAAKQLVADFDSLGLSRLDNTEGMCWGPRLPNGRRTLVCVSDDNFNPLQVTQFAAFEYLESE